MLLFASACVAEDESPDKLSVAAAITRALNINTSVKRAEASYLTSLSNLRIAGFTTSYGLGTRTSINHNQNDAGLSGTAYGNLIYEGISGTEASLEFSPFGLGNDRGALSLTFRKPLKAGKGLLSTKADQLAGARSNTTVQEKELFLTRQSTVLNVIEAYYRAVLAREEVKVQERAVEITEEAAEGARLRAEAGLVRGIDVSRAEIRVARTRDQLNLQRQTARAAKDRLMTAIGAGIGEDPELTDEIPEPLTNLPDLAKAVQIALENRAEFVVYDEQMADQQRRLAMAEDRLRPRLDLVAGYNSFSKDPGVISASLLEFGDFRAGVEYRFPIDKRVDAERRDIANRDLDVLRRLRTYQMEQVTEQVRRAYRNVETAKTTLDILSENVKVAEDNLRLALRMVEEGIDDNRVVLDAQESLTQVEVGLLSAKVDLYLAGINLLYAMGQDLTVLGLE